MRCEHLHDSAVYVLGALSPPEREAYERHLAECAECRAEVAEFSDLPGLLGRLDPEIAAQIALASDPDDPPSRWAGPTAAPSADPVAAAGLTTEDLWGEPPISDGGRWAGPTMAGADPPAASPPAAGGPSSAASTPSARASTSSAASTSSRASTSSAASTSAGASTSSGAAGSGRVNGAPVDPLLPRVLDRARTERRTEQRRRRLRTAGVALVAAFIGVLAVLGVRAAGVGQPDFEAMQEAASTVPVTASLALSPDSDGTVVRMHCAYKPGEGDEYAKWTYTLVVIPKSGDPDVVNTWTARSGDEMDLTAHSHIPRSAIQRVEIRKGDGTPLLTLAT